jgi:hypothetical protein
VCHGSMDTCRGSTPRSSGGIAGRVS